MFLSLKMIRAQWNGKKFTIQSNYIFPQNLFPLVYLQFVQLHIFLGVDPSFVDMSKYIDFSSDRWLMLLFFIAFLKLLGTFQLHTSFLMNQWFFQFFCNISTSCIFSHFSHFLSRKYHQKLSPTEIIFLENLKNPLISWNFDFQVTTDPGYKIMLDLILMDEMADHPSCAPGSAYLFKMTCGWLERWKPVFS